MTLADTAAVTDWLSENALTLIVTVASQIGILVMVSFRFGKSMATQKTTYESTIKELLRSDEDLRKDWRSEMATLRTSLESRADTLRSEQRHVSERLETAVTSLAKIESGSIELAARVNLNILDRLVRLEETTKIDHGRIHEVNGRVTEFLLRLGLVEQTVKRPGVKP